MAAAKQLSWLERRASDRKFAGSMPILGITSLCPWERHLTLISNRLFVWCGKTAQGSVSQQHLPEKKLKNKQKNKRTWYCRYLRKWVWAIALCLTSDVFPRVRRINRTNKQTISLNMLKTDKQ